MKNLSKIGWLVAGLALPTFGFASTPQLAALEQRFPHVIPVRDFPMMVHDGYGVAVTRILGDRAQLAPGGTYLLEGMFFLKPGRTATLAAYSPSASPAQLRASQAVLLHGGLGQFAMIAKMNSTGSLNFAFFKAGTTRILGGKDALTPPLILELKPGTTVCNEHYPHGYYDPSANFAGPEFSRPAPPQYASWTAFYSNPVYPGNTGLPSAFGTIASRH